LTTAPSVHSLYGWCASRISDSAAEVFFYNGNKMDSQIKLTIPRIAEIEAALADKLRIAATQELAAAMANLQITPRQELEAMLATAEIAISPVHGLATALADIRIGVRQMLAPYQEAISAAFTTATLIQQNFEQWKSELQLNWAKMAEMMAAGAASFEQYCNEEAPEACAVLCQAGWLKMDRHFSITEVRESLVLHKTQGEAAMNNAILQYFSEDNWASLERMTESWNSIPYLRNRKGIIADALFAHRSGLYTLSVPALLPFVDGLSAEILGSHSKNAVAKFAENRRANDPEIWVQGFCDFMAQVFYKGYRFGQDSAPYLNRHAILHGRVFDYPSVLNSTRVFLLLDALADFWYERQEGLAPMTIQ
jgi:hypothetical protein